MNYLILYDLLLFLEDLFRTTPDDKGNPPRRPYAEMTEVGRLYLVLLEAKLNTLRILPQALVGKPLTNELGQTDALHDGIGAAIFALLEAIERHPRFSAGQKEAARRIRAAFIPALGELRRSYAEKAAKAKRHQGLLGERAEDLRSFAVPTPAGAEPQTLHDWLVDFLAQGEKLDQLLSERASISMADPNAGMGAQLRTEIIAMVGAFRTVLAQELRGKADLPRNLEGMVFGYLDELCRTREKAAKAQAQSQARSEAEAAAEVSEEPVDEEA